MMLVPWSIPQHQGDARPREVLKPGELVCSRSSTTMFGTDPAHLLTREARRDPGVAPKWTRERTSLKVEIT